jgi:15-cis-phytoene synthase
MVNKAVRRAERALALGYAPADARAALVALWALDDRLRQIVLAARDPTIGLMRLTWWAEALAGLDEGPAPAEPVLRGLAAEVLPRGVTGTGLAAMVDGWERLLDPAPDLAAYAAERGGRLFAMAAKLLGGADARVVAAGEGWALADVVAGWPGLATEARALAEERLSRTAGRWARALRSLGALALLARSDLAGGAAAGSPARVGRLLWHRLSGW